MERFGEHTKNLEFQFSQLGEVYSYTTVYDAPVGFEEFVPYIIALVKLKEGILITTQLTDISPDEVHIGQQVEMVTRKLSEQGEKGIINYGYKFRPVFANQSHNQRK